MYVGKKGVAMNQKVMFHVLKAVHSCGHTSIKNIMLHIEESLTSDEAKEVRAFLKWAFFDWENRGFGPLTIDSRYNEWRMSLGPVSVSSRRRFLRCLVRLIHGRIVRL